MHGTTIHPGLYFLLTASAFAQYPVEANRLADVAREFEAAARAPSLRCAVQTISPVLTFSLQREAAYTLQFPKGEFDSAAHTLDVALKITSNTPRVPLFLASHHTLAAGLDARSEIAVSGRFLLLTGDFRIQSIAVDEAGRVCRAVWKVSVKPVPKPPKLHSRGRLTIILDATPAPPLF